MTLRPRPVLARHLAGVVLLLATVAALARGTVARAEDAAGGSLLDRARRAAGEQKVSAAIELYFQALRAADDYATKYGIRDEILALPSERAAPIHEGERATVARRVAEERSRDIDQKASAMEGRGAHRGAMYLWRRLYDLEGVDDGKKKQIDATVERITRRLCDEATDEEKAEAKGLHGDEQDPAAALARADQAAAAGKGRVALKVYSHVSYSSFASQDLKDTARARIAALRKQMVEEVPPEEQADADKVWNDPHWSYLGTAVSRQYVYIGPKTFVDSLTEPDKLKLDLACVFLGDLVGRDQVEDAGQRLSIYYKERFDFGGGIGGGHRIDIGNKVITRPIAGELHFHETSHCVFNVGMIYKGFVEGIANFGATFALDALGRHAEADAAIASNRKGYKDDYLDRRVRYWRIASYAPSCGFLFTPITAKDPVARQAEWAKYRQFFRRVRQTMPDEPRDAERIRYFAYLWGATFGWQMLDESGRARFPVTAADREKVAVELEQFYEETARGESYADQEFYGMAAEPLQSVIERCPPGQLVDRAKFAMARTKAGLEDLAGRDALYKELGVVPAWKLCLPFYSALRGIDALHAVFEPERETVLAAEYPNPNQTARWMDAKITPDGVVDLLEHGVGYPDDAVAYALAVLEVPADVPDAVCYVAYDDLCAMWVNRTLVEKWEGERGWLRRQGRRDPPEGRPQPAAAEDREPQRRMAVLGPRRARRPPPHRGARFRQAARERRAAGAPGVEGHGRLHARPREGEGAAEEPLQAHGGRVRVRGPLAARQRPRLGAVAEVRDPAVHVEEPADRPLLAHRQGPRRPHRLRAGGDDARPGDPAARRDAPRRGARRRPLGAHLRGLGGRVGREGGALGVRAPRLRRDGAGGERPRARAAVPAARPHAHLCRRRQGRARCGGPAGAPAPGLRPHALGQGHVGHPGARREAEVGNARSNPRPCLTRTSSSTTATARSASRGAVDSCGGRASPTPTAFRTTTSTPTCGRASRPRDCATS